MAITSLLTAIVLGVRTVGILQPSELVVFDWMLREKPPLKPDSRLLIVEISEPDISFFERYPLSDEIVADTLSQLLALDPQVIGLDLYRDIAYEPGHQKFQNLLQNTANIIVIQTLPTPDNPGIPAPVNVVPERIGFNDLVLDPDSVIRRNLISVATEEATFLSFSAQLALNYLAAQGITPRTEPDSPDVFLGAAQFVPLQQHSGGYRKIDNQGYQILLNYRAARNIAPTVSIKQVLDGEVDPRLVKDKIVLLGTTAPSGKDLFLSPFSPGETETPKMAGVVIHAQMVSQILDAALGDRSLFKFWPEWAEILWILLWATIGTTLAHRSRTYLGLMFGIPLLICLIFAWSWLLFSRAYWLPMVSPAMALILTGGVGIAYRALQSQQQQQMTMKLLGQNISPEIAEALWQGREHLLEDGKLQGRRLTATIMFTDIQNFSTVSEEKEPEELLEWLNVYLAMMTESVHQHHGIVNKFTGDGIMAGFGVPISRKTDAEIAQDAYDAVVCALDIGDRLQQMNQLSKSQGSREIRLRIGIFTGPIVAGSLGSKDRLEYGLLGDSVNIASRLESCCKEKQAGPCRILVAKQTVDYIEGRFELESWGEIPLKGRQQMVNVYRVVGQLEGSNRETSSL
ncbi:MAG: adenylate/guanylate cyclase domain-containing protein [Oscillatoriales cyanobacterium RM2_1_1]|nr:adenylate/guanylate cyclase domain-containing protein [Oscillatoriales cyanobacterium SM2_3_0]NJO47020.1 adenylate/guanylate cyclase domain-containing protein [Oscillatoriales cyanobacterium RM2_1_1]